MYVSVELGKEDDDNKESKNVSGAAWVCFVGLLLAWPWKNKKEMIKKETEQMAIESTEKEISLKNMNIFKFSLISFWL